MSILWNTTEATVVEKMSLPVITTGTQNMGGGVYKLKAGTPLDEDLAVANDDDAVYIVAEDFFFVTTNPNQERMVPVIKSGYVDLNKAEAASGLTYTDDCIAALGEAGITLVDGQLPSGGGESGALLVGFTLSSSTYTADKTADEIFTAASKGPVIGYADGLMGTGTQFFQLTFAEKGAKYKFSFTRTEYMSLMNTGVFYSLDAETTGGDGSAYPAGSLTSLMFGT